MPALDELVTGEPAAPTAPPVPEYREFGDHDSMRQMIFDNVMGAAKTAFPISNERHTLRLADLSYHQPKRFTNAEQKQAIMRGQTLGQQLRGRWEMVDNATGEVTQKTGRRMIARVPYLTNRGTFINNGSEYTVAHQMRLRPGVYSRKKDNGELEAHFNVKRGTGSSFRVWMDPETGVFRMRTGQANLKLFPILRAMGVTDAALRKSWGRELLAKNMEADDPRAVHRAFNKLVGTSATAAARPMMTATAETSGGDDPYQEEGPSSFTHWGRKYDLNALLKRTRDREVEEAPIDQLAWILRHNKNLDPGRVDAADTTKPVLLHKTVVVDGVHRLQKAVQEGKTTLPFQRVDDDDLEAVRAQLAKSASDEGVGPYLYHLAPAAAEKSIDEKGLLSSLAIANDPEALSIARSPEEIADWKKRFEDEKDVFADRRGPNLFFQPPPEGQDLPEDHPLNKPHVLYRIAMAKLREKYPDAKFQGMELEDIDRLAPGKTWWDMTPEQQQAVKAKRYHQLSEEELTGLLQRTPEELWSAYDRQPGMYASNVPHLAFLAEGGKIAPELLEKMGAFEYEEAGENAAPGVQAAIDDFDDQPESYKEHRPLLYHILGEGTPDFKMSKDDADYVERSEATGQYCANCEYAYKKVVRPQLICSKINGDISAMAWCRLWESDHAKRASAAEKKHDKAYSRESAKIRENQQGKGSKSHKFVSAEYTFPNGHPRCLLCGDEEGVDDMCPGHEKSAALTSAEVAEAAKKTDTSPTEAQKTSGRYRKGRLSLHGLRIAIENPKGSSRSGTAEDGTKWATLMHHHYGYIEGTEGADTDAVDVFIGSHPESEMAFVVNQLTDDGKSFDEHKVMLGFNNEADAKAGYLANYDAGWKGMGAVTGLTMPQFKTWLEDGDQTAAAEDFTPTEKAAQTDEGSDPKNRRRAMFSGTLRCDDSNANKPWIYVEVDGGLADSAFNALKDEGLDVQRNPGFAHITVAHNDETKELIDKYSKTRWKTRCGNGTRVRFSLSNALVTLKPEGWKGVNKVYFLEVRSRQLQAYREALNLPAKMPNKHGDGSFEFHITVAIEKEAVKAAYDAMTTDQHRLEEQYFAHQHVLEKAGGAVNAIRAGLTKEALTADDRGAALREVFDKAELDNDTTALTLGQSYANAGVDSILAATSKLVGINRGEQQVDDRDSLAFQTFHGPEDMFAERLTRDAGGHARKLLWKSTLRGNLKHVPTGALTRQLDSVIMSSGLGSTLEEVNPMEIFDQQVRVSRMGEGGMPSTDSIPDEARNVQPSHFGLLDPIRAPENTKIGVDSRITHQTFKGRDGQLYTQVMRPDGRKTNISAANLIKSTVAFPGELEGDNARVRAMIGGRRIGYVSRETVDYQLPDASHMFTPTSNLVPMISGIKGGRLLMGAKMSTQALPLRDAEAPLVQSMLDGGRNVSFENLYGKHMGAVRAKGAGVVEAVSKDGVRVRYADGRTAEHDLYDNFPFNRKTYIHNTPSVKVGDTVKKGGLLAKSNFTDAEGTTALGKNLRVAFMAYEGFNSDDAVVISESAARKLSSEHMYPHKYKKGDNHEMGRDKFSTLFPTRFDRRQLEMIGEEGIIQRGMEVKKGDPLILAAARRDADKGKELVRSRKNTFTDAAVTWDHAAPGVVTDVDQTPQGWKVMVKAYAPMQIGDKLSNRYGGKGVISRIISDDQMPHTADGKPAEALFNPLGVISRVNPSQVIEMALAKVARKTGKPVKIPGFMKESMIDYAERLLKENGLSDTEDLYDPRDGRKIPKVMTGEQFLLKLHHTAEGKHTERDIGSYTSEDTPASGGKEGSKRLGNIEMNALLSHGATNVIRDAKLVRGQKNEDYWRAFRLGYNPPSPDVPTVYNKFMAHLQGAGINLEKNGDTTNLYAMTDKDVDRLSFGELENADTVNAATLEPIKGGLFDVGATGGHGGKRWQHISLSEPVPNPVMEEPIRRMLGLTQAKFEDVISGKTALHGRRGGQAIHEALARVRVPDAIRFHENIVRSGPRSRRDNSVKLLGYLKTFERAGMKPEQLMLNKIPVIPPNFRPIQSVEGTQIVADANRLYQDLFNANGDFGLMRDEVDDSALTDERLLVYNSVKAVTGLGDPTGMKSKEQGARGLLKHVFGSSPKLGMFQRRVLGASMDLVGRGVITPNPELNMDQVGLPEKQAWKLYRPFAVRRLVQGGMGAMAAATAVENETEAARDAIQAEMRQRPVIISRAPVLHRYGTMAAFPQLVKGDTLQIPPIVTPGFNADFDGDAMNYHVPVEEDARKEAILKMLPSRNLTDVANFDVHYTPRQEFLHGLHLASTARKKAPPRIFASKADAIRAYRRGDIGIGHRVVIKEQKES